MTQHFTINKTDKIFLNLLGECLLKGNLGEKIDKFMKTELTIIFPSLLKIPVLASSVLELPFHPVLCGLLLVLI